MAPVLGMLLGFTGIGYACGSVMAVMALYDSRKSRWANRLAILGWSAQSAWFLAVWLHFRMVPFVTLYDWVAFFVWLSTAGYLFIMSRASYESAVGFLLPVIFSVWAVGQLLPSTESPLPADLSGWRVVAHIVLATAAYTAFLLSAVFATMYTEKERELKRKSLELFYYRLPALGEMDRLSAQMITLGLPLLTLAMVLGSVIAKARWGHYWSWNPKETWSLTTWVIYVLYLGFRWRLGWRGHLTAVWAMGAFLLVLANFFGINLLFGGHHSYNF